MYGKLYRGLWIVIALCLAALTALGLLPKQGCVTYLVSGILACIYYFVGMWLIYFIAAIKDPNVRNASKLHMNVTRFKKYECLYNCLHEHMKKYGSESKETEEYFFKQVFPKLNNLNEFRRYCAYRLQQQRDVFKERMEELTKA